jgi:hypothetical protein
MTVNSRFTNVSYITVYITAGQRPDRSFHFSKYFLLGSTPPTPAQFNNPGSLLLRGRLTVRLRVRQLRAVCLAYVRKL